MLSLRKQWSNAVQLHLGRICLLWHWRDIRVASEWLPSGIPVVSEWYPNGMPPAADIVRFVAECTEVT